MEEMGTLPGWVSEVGDLQGVSPLQPTQVPGTVSEKQQTPRQTLGRPNARPTLTADLGESKPPQPLKANGLMRGCSRKRAPTRLPGTRGNGHCRPRAAALPPPTARAATGSRSPPGPSQPRVSLNLQPQWAREGRTSSTRGRASSPPLERLPFPPSASTRLGSAALPHPHARAPTRRLLHARPGTWRPSNSSPPGPRSAPPPASPGASGPR